MSEGFPIEVQIMKGDRAITSDAPALTLIPATDAPMHETSRKYRWFFGGELAVSLLLHTLVAVALTGVVARQFAQPQVDPISVELVAPPEPKAPEPKAQELKIPELEQPKPEVPEPDEKQPPEQKPEEQKPPEQKQEEQKQEEKKQEVPKAEQPPPPPPPPSEQKPEQKPEEKPVEPEKQAEPDTSTEPEKKAEPDKTAEEKPAPEILKPVVEFGDTDSGPRKAEDGSAAQEANTSEQPEDKPTEPQQAAEGTGKPEEAQKAETDPADTPPDETADDQETPQEEQPQSEQTETNSSEAPAPQILTSDTAADAAPDDFGTVGRIVTSATPAPKPAQRPAARTASNSSATSARQNGSSGRQGPPLIEARRLLSSAADGGPRARSAMAGMPPGQRLNYLCRTELDAQLLDWDPSRPPEMLPSFRPQGGNVLEPGQAAYGSRGDWYDLNFRCETDKGVTRVVKFSFRIGPPIPPAKWQARGLPPF
ncbi:DUF930 domain-containing protein [Roseibium sp.]|uniref:DUF930 domain-containing protein n=1 Tax=Roseibium sp. TaxID=1936156 RepID=UPI003A988523